MITLTRASLAVFVCAATACTASYPTEPTSATPLALVMQLATPRGKVVPGTAASSTYTFSVFTVDSDNVYSVVTSKATWLSSDSGVAQLRSAGTFSGVAPGRAEAIVRYEGLEARAEMVVVDAAVQAGLLPRMEVAATTSPRLGGAAVRATANRRRQSSITGSVEVASVTNLAEWSSSDPGIARVDAGGVITPVSLGTVVITASLEGISDWIWVSVLPQQP